MLPSEDEGDENEAPAGPPPGGPDFDFVWEEYQKQLAAQKEWEENGVDIHPDYGFVAKTRIEPSGVKVFLNLVSSPQVRRVYLCFTVPDHPNFKLKAP